MSQYCYNLKSSFEKIASNYPEKIALKYIDKKNNLTYQNLDKLSNQLARLLLANDIKKNDVIAIANGKKPSTFIAMIACLKVGAIYTNLDEDNPISRTKNIIDSCKPKLLFTDNVQNNELTDLTQELNVPIIQLSLANIKEYSNKPIILLPEITRACPAYIMFTSGSTGTPKGVVISHGNLLNFISWSIECFNITANDTFANVSPIYFDNSVFDIYTSLFSGASLAPICKSITKKPDELVKQIDELACTIWFSVPSLLIYLNTFKVLTSEVFKYIRCISFGGEGFPKTELKKIYTKYSSRIRFTNVYGPTEATCICSSYGISDKDFHELNGILPLGFINPNFDYLVLNDQNQKVAVGEIGELCLLGSNIGLGYYGDFDKTQKVFTLNPIEKNFTDIMYRTGDLVYQSKENEMLYFSGRIDNQIKHMGYRIELDEIEHAINFLSYILQSVVVYERVNDAFGKIITFIVYQNTANKGVLLEDLKRVLPEYMIPNEVIVLERLPNNNNGKIDRVTLKKQLRESNL